MSSSPFRFAVVGSGWRSEFFVRMARLLPDRFTCVAVVSRDPERGGWVEREWGVPTVRAIADLPALSPQLVVTGTPWPVTPEAITELVGLGLPVLAETPPAPDVAGLRELWASVGSSGLVQVAEHSPCMPAHQARIAVVESGLIGEPTSVQISSTHLYHAVGLIRRLLGVGRGPVVVRSSQFDAPLVDPMTRDGWNGRTEPRQRSTILATLDFGEGRSALYDFTDNQWHNPLRANRIVVRGSHGEIVDGAVTRWVDAQTVVTSAIERRQTGIEQQLDGWDTQHISLDGRVLWRNPFEGARLADDDVAVATLLERCSAWVRGEGPEPYPLADGAQDHLVGLAIEESARTGSPVTAGPEAWS